MNALVLVMAGGALGAGLRHLVGRAALSALGAAWPWGTLFVNVSGGLAMGLLAATLSRMVSGEPWRLFLGVGVLGGFTTFSAFSLDAVMMMERGAWAQMLAYVAASVLGSIAALALGFGLARSAA
ncbi:camphor resistance protein CrcB [Sphingomonas sp. OV641]|uniref:fluoride efflux transporter CrcB n=1 Tax=Sphingomonas sp. OV641 TaxID=1881068 RepID=UPI0008CEEAE3|nr:fluoride efflux transporter CrcB [Sphingomonas sp. OV641]SEI96448.1 camphor resistance protein CrcB [Sphingomonas sp. OV641]